MILEIVRKQVVYNLQLTDEELAHLLMALNYARTSGATRVETNQLIAELQDLHLQAKEA